MVRTYRESGTCVRNRIRLRIRSRSYLRLRLSLVRPHPFRPSTSGLSVRIRPVRPGPVRARSFRPSRPSTFVHFQQVLTFFWFRKLCQGNCYIDRALMQTAYCSKNLEVMNLGNNELADPESKLVAEWLPNSLIELRPYLLF